MPKTFTLITDQHCGTDAQCTLEKLNMHLTVGNGQSWANYWLKCNSITNHKLLT